MNRLFYIIYNSYYKHGKYNNDNPSLTVGGMFLVFFLSICLDIAFLIKLMEDPLFLNFPKKSKPIMLLVISMFGSIVYFLFFYNQKHHKIYEIYKEDVFLNSKTAKYLGFFIVFFTIVSPLIIGLIRNKIYFDYWI